MGSLLLQKLGYLKDLFVILQKYQMAMVQLRHTIQVEKSNGKASIQVACWTVWKLAFLKMEKRYARGRSRGRGKESKGCK